MTKQRANTNTHHHQHPQQTNVSTGLIQGWAKPFCKKTIDVLHKWTLFLAGPHIQAIQISRQLCSNVDIKDSWAHQILQRAHKISNGPLKLENLHVFEWD